MTQESHEHLSLQPGEVLFREGDRGDILYVIATGELRVEKLTGDAANVISTLGAGEFVGEMSALIGTPRTATVIANTDAELLPYPADTLEDLIRSRPTIALRIIRMLAARLAQTTERLSLDPSLLTQAD